MQGEKYIKIECFKTYIIVHILNRCIVVFNGKCVQLHKLDVP